MSQIRRLVSDSVIYGLGYVGARIVTFFLTPYHTNIFTTEIYGVYSLGMVFVGIVQIIYRYGNDFSLIRHYELTETDEEKRLVFSSTFWPLILTSLLLSGILLLARDPLSFVVFGSSEYGHLFFLLTPIIFFDTFVILSKTLLRLKERPVYFSVVNLLNVLVTFGLNIYFISFLGMGVQGAFLANIVASGAMLLTLLPAILQELEFKFSFPHWKKIVFFGFPLLASGLASMIMELINRPILQWLTDLDTAGLYSGAYKFGIFMLLVTTAFNFAWQPFFMKVGQQKEGPRIFARVFTYFVFVLCGMFILLTVSIEYIATMRIPFTAAYLLGENFHSAIPMIPIVFAAYIFYGIYLNFMPGIYLKNKSGKLAKYTAIGAIVNITGNFLLIPWIGFYGAAVATLLSYVTMAILLYFSQMRLYPTPYRWRKVGITFGITLLLTALFYLIQPGISGRIGLVVLYIILHFAFGFIKFSELKELYVSFRSRRKTTHGDR